MSEVKNQVTEQRSTNKVTDFSLGIFGTSDNFIMAREMAKMLADSTIVPKDFQGNVSNCIIAVEMAVRLQTSPMMVMQHLYVVYGRPSWSAQYVIAMINGSGKYDMELQFDEKTDANGNPYSCVCWTEKNGRKVTGPTITMDLAKAEGWISKNGSKWQTMPQIMLRYRAASFFGRMNCPDLMMGMYTREEQYEMGKDEYLEDMATRVQVEIEANSNQEEFVQQQIEEKPNPPTVSEMTGNQEVKEPVPSGKKKKEIPDFMDTSNL